MVMNRQETAKVNNTKTGKLHVQVDFLIGKDPLECIEIGEHLVYIAISQKIKKLQCSRECKCGERTCSDSNRFHGIP